MNIITEYDEYYAGAFSSGGSAHAVSENETPVNEAVRLLHEAVKEVTGLDVEEPVRARIGFLP